MIRPVLAMRRPAPDGDARGTGCSDRITRADHARAGRCAAKLRNSMVILTGSYTSRLHASHPRCISRNGSAQRARSFIGNELGELVAGLAGVSAIGGSGHLSGHRGAPNAS